MLINISEILSNIMVRYNLIERKDLEIYNYGWYQLLILIINIGIIFILGIITKEIISLIIYLTMFSFLRSYAGGYHALTARRCFAINVFSYIFVILIIKYTSVDAYLFWILLCFSSVIIIGLSPVASCNKPLDLIEIKKYRKMTIIIWLIESSILLFLRYLQFNKTAMCILMAQLTVSLALILGKIAEGRSKNI